MRRRSAPRSLACRFAGLLVGLVVGAGGCAHSPRARAPGCAAPAAEIAAIWGAERRARVDARARSIGVDHLEHLAARVVDGIDRASAAWIDERDGMCRIAARRKDRARLAAAIACQDAAAAALGGVIRRFESADAAALEGSEAALDRWDAGLRGCTWTVRRGLPPVAGWAVEVAELAALLAADAEARAVAEAALADGLAEAREGRLVIAAAALRGDDLDAAREALAPLVDARIDARVDEGVDDPRADAIEALQVDLHLAAGEHAEAAAIGRRIVGRHRGSGWRSLGDRIDAVHALVAAASALRRIGAQDDALRAALLAQLYEGYTRLEGPRRATADVAEAVAVIEAGRGDYDRSIAAHLEALSIRRVVVGDHHPDTATSHHHLGAGYEATARYDLARVHYERALAIRMRALGDHPLTARTYNNLGNLALREGDLDEASERHAAARRIRVAAYGEDHAETATSDLNLGMIDLARGDAEAARRRFERVLAIRERALGPEHPYTALVHNNLGLALAALGDDEGALVEHQRALAARLAFFGEDHLEVARSHHNLGALLLGRGDLEGAAPHLAAALAIRRRHLPPNHPELESTLRLVGRLERASRPLVDEGWAP